MGHDKIFWKLWQQAFRLQFFQSLFSQTVFSKLYFPKCIFPKFIGQLPCTGLKLALQVADHLIFSHLAKTLVTEAVGRQLWELLITSDERATFLVIPRCINYQPPLQNIWCGMSIDITCLFMSSTTDNIVIYWISNKSYNMRLSYSSLIYPISHKI